MGSAPVTWALSHPRARALSLSLPPSLSLTLSFSLNLSRYAPGKKRAVGCAPGEVRPPPLGPAEVGNFEKLPACFKLTPLVLRCKRSRQRASYLNFQAADGPHTHTPHDVKHFRGGPHVPPGRCVLLLRVLLGARFSVPVNSVHMAHIRQSRPDFGLGFRVKVLQKFQSSPLNRSEFPSKHWTARALFFLRVLLGTRFSVF